MMKNKKALLIIILPLLLLGLLLFSCNPPEPEDTTFLSILSSTYELPADKQATATITATVYDNKHVLVVDGTAVYFIPNNCGTLDASVATTAGGQASVTLTASDYPCNAQIQVEVPDENRRGTSDPISMYDIGPQAISLSSDPSQIRANGKDQCTITAYAVIDEEEAQPVPDGTEILFTVSRGTLDKNSDTTVNGYASVTLTAGTDPGSCIAVATLEDQSAEITIEFTSVEATNIVVSSNIDTIRADGVSQASITAEVWLIRDVEHVEDGTMVYFSTTLGTLSAAEAETENGKARTTLTSAKTPGWAKVNGSSGGGMDYVQIYFYSVGPSDVDIKAVPNSIPADGNSTSTISAVVTNSEGEPVEAGVTVSFSTTHGSLSSSTASTDDNGTCAVRLTSATLPEEEVKVTAVAGDEAANVYVEFYDIGPASMTLKAIPSSIPADGQSTSTISAVVTNSNGDPVSVGTEVLFSTTDGSLSSSSATTDTNGAAEVILTSSTQENSNVQVSAVAGTINKTVTVAFTPPISTDVAYLVVDSNYSEITVGTSILPEIYVQVNNEYHDGLPGKTVILDIDCGIIYPDDRLTTNANGECTFYIDLINCRMAGIINVTATCENVTGTDTIELLPDLPCTLLLSADSYIINGGTASGSTTLRMTVIDRWGNAVRDQTPVTLFYDNCSCPTCNSLSFGYSTVYTSSGGASTTFTAGSGTNPGPGNCSVDITATAANPDSICEAQDLHWDKITITITP
ncbi:Ig-like domain-containing protein [candidate division CSSED10-310 bacterium]|uniref:Ig-like domain-containing protein n=1 Tax=candidate division CSSED10-310 bacterium TaxID=2855610 RepID=A0ABV6YZH4_UNCC1